VEGKEYNLDWVADKSNYRYVKHNPFRKANSQLPGKITQVYYHPKNPEIATLSPGMKFDGFVKVIIIILFLFGGLLRVSQKLW